MQLANILIIALVCLTAYTANTERGRLSELVKECQKESGSTVNEIEIIRNNGVITPDTGKQALCVNRKFGVLDQNGDVIPDQFNQHIEVLSGGNSDARKEFKDNCSKTEGENPEAKAIKFVKCMQTVLAKYPV
ncbi:uncharacterized protein LOC126879002 [Diabrotica virgifera virgifera]|uniref:Uncharacterized protein n=1 Tax=Diabrotica virgifera virgifera TaxID=50390 RepID=A0ABM5JIR8_DIAVI|nr:uncharacterized protein LOC126879002 [Diabrotica virgifera virgifera]